jgi:enoyl-CoA hydratase
MSDLITLERSGSVALAVLTAPKANALSQALVTELRDVLHTVETDDSIGCLALISGNRSFCSGADLDAIRAAGPDPLEQSAYAGFGRIYDLFGLLLAAPVPTIAGIGGHVVGAGINLALACDVRIVADDVQVRGFAAAQVHPGGGHLRMVTSQLRPDWAAALTLLGQPLDAAAAVASGFAWRSVPASELRSEVLAAAAGAGTDVSLTRSVTASYRATRSSFLSPQAAILLERAPQVWSMRRRA